MTSAAVEIRNLHKAYGPLRALNGLELTAQPARVTAILGRNGAGKTTAIEICEGYRRPDRGMVTVLGQPAGSKSLRARVGVMPQTGGAYQAARVSELLSLFASFYAQPMDVRELLDRVGLTERSGSLVKKLSGGEAQKLSLALAIVGRPELVFLDEPTAGLDVEARHCTWELISDLRKAGVTVILTTHYLEEAESLADDVVMIADGVSIATGTPGDFAALATPAVVFTTADDVSGLTLTLRAEAGRYIVEGAHDAKALAAVAAALDEAGISVQQLGLERPSLEATFLKLTGSSK